MDEAIKRWNRRIAQNSFQKNLTISAIILPNMTNCIFSEPVNLGSDSWAYSKMNCETEDLELIQNETTGSKFYLNKSISYGDILLISFVIIYAIILVAKTIAGFVFRRN